MAPANTRVGASGFQRLTRTKFANFEPEEAKSNEPSNSEPEKLSGPIEIIISDGDDSSDDDGSAQMNSDNSDSLRSKQLFLKTENFWRTVNNERPANARTTGDLDGELDFLGNGLPQAHDAGHSFMTPGEIPDEEGSDGEDPRGMQISNADNNTDTNADANANPQASIVDANAATNANTQPNRTSSSEASTSSSEASTAARAGGKRKAPSTGTKTKKRKLSNALSQDASHGGELHCIEAEALSNERAQDRFRVDWAFYGRPTHCDNAWETAVPANLPFRYVSGESGHVDTSMVNTNVDLDRCQTHTDHRSKVVQEANLTTPTKERSATATGSCQCLLMNAIIQRVTMDGCVLKYEIDGRWTMIFEDKPDSGATEGGPATIWAESVSRQCASYRFNGFQGMRARVLQTIVERL